MTHGESQNGISLDEVYQDVILGEVLTSRPKVTELLDSDKLSPEERMKAKLILGLILYRDGHEKEAIALSSDVLKESTESGNSQIRLESLHLIITALVRLGKYTDAESLCLQFENIVASLSELNADQRSSLNTRIIYQRSRICLYSGNRAKAIAYSQQCVEVWESLGNEIELARSLNLLGLCAYGEGEYKVAQERFIRAAGISRRIGFKLILSHSLNNLAMISSEKGELETALEYFNECLSMDVEQGRIVGQSNRLHNIATVYADMGNFVKAKEYSLKGLALIEDSENYQSLALSYYTLANYSLELEDMKDNSLYLKRLLLITNLSNDDSVLMLYEVGKATKLETHGGTDELNEAKEIFRKYIDAKITYANLRIKCMLLLCRILLHEVKSSQNPDAMTEIQNILNAIDRLASDQKSFRLQTEVLTIKAKIALIELKPKEAQKMLNVAQAIAQKKGLLKIAKRISHEYDSLMEQMSVWTSMLQRKTSLQERLDLSAIDNSLGVALRQHEGESFSPPEVPVMLLFIQRDIGLTIYTKKFDFASNVDGAVFGAFITAFDLFLRDTLDSEDMVERVKAGEYTLAMKSVEWLTLCYVFKGHSYFAIEKLHTLSTEIMKNADCFKSLMEKNRILTKDEETLLDVCIQNVFGS
ncbi:MAG: tetratricopeptide repeat protein [Candidatus Thorarchaeota archaeon]